MVAIAAAPATARQVAVYGDVTARIRSAMALKGMKVSDLNKALGRPISWSSGYQWYNGKGAPGKSVRPKVSKLLDIPERYLMPRKAGMTQEVVVASPHPAKATPAAAPVLSFSVTDDGTARLRLDITTPVNRGVALLRILLDAGMVVSQESE